MKDATLFFYDLETSGFYPRSDRIMQFGGQRTDLNLNPIGPPYNLIIKLTKDILPDPMAVMTHGITPQATLKKGITEAEFLKLFYKDLALPNTVFVGFNNIRFDDEFIRFCAYRNYWDPYEWHWSVGRSRWDMLDTARMTRALRPEGLKWPFAPDGKASNKLEHLSLVNNLSHDNAHDALSDVNATIALARLIKSKQPKLFNWMLKMRNKRLVANLAKSGQPFIYTSGKYPDEYQKTTVVWAIADHPDRQGVLVYDLRHDPKQFANLTPPELAKAWRRMVPESELSLPIKTMQYNRCPAVAPLNALDKKSQNRIKLNMLSINKNLAELKKIKSWPKNLYEALAILDKERQTTFLKENPPADARLYDDFFTPSDKRLMQSIRSSQAEVLTKLNPDFKDERLYNLWLPFKARNYPSLLNQAEQKEWQKYVSQKLKSQSERWLERFNEVMQTQKPNNEQQHLLSELRAWLAVTPQSPEQE